MSERRRYRANGNRLVEGFDPETGKLTEWLTRDAAIWWAGDGCELLEELDADGVPQASACLSRHNPKTRQRVKFDAADIEWIPEPEDPPFI